MYILYLLYSFDWITALSLFFQPLFLWVSILQSTINYLIIPIIDSSGLIVPAVTLTLHQSVKVSEKQFGLTEAQLAALTELCVLSRIHVSSVSLQTLNIHTPPHTHSKHSVIIFNLLYVTETLIISRWPLTSILSCLTGSTSCFSANERNSPVWSIHARKSWASRCRRWFPPAARPPEQQTDWVNQR